ncbi:hypothetical protein [Coleofasciculus sp. E1-EBD-02]|uniref:hypothetical protein n=1 Tax=Coleofasciculus sp. E1-EBD-02 TaxID=3068481 RepID=UPI0032F4FC23
MLNSTLPPIYFYLPPDDLLESKLAHLVANGLPENADTYWKGFSYGLFCWNLQTYLRLKADGFPCQLVRTIPEEGIIISHREGFPNHLKPGRKLLMVCIKADRPRHPYAQLHIIQNPQNNMLKKSMMTVGDAYYLPHWPQPGLIPRNPARRDRFENIAFFGNQYNLAPELKYPSWKEKLNALGLSWRVVKRDKWNDYSETDAIVAMRSFSQLDVTLKPATKLYNAWSAGVIAILGCESAYRAERKSELDYLEVNSLNEVILSLKRLRDDKGLRQAMIENGRVRAEEVKPASTSAKWRSFIEEIAIPAYKRWCTTSDWNRQNFLMRNYLAHKVDKVSKITKELRNPNFILYKSKEILPK